jgi:hypothetical protein
MVVGGIGEAPVLAAYGGAATRRSLPPFQWPALAVRGPEGIRH